MARRNMLIPGMIIFTIVTGGATILLALIGGTLDWLARPIGFSDADFAAVKAGKKEGFESRWRGTPAEQSASVKEVSMLREAQNKLTGYAKLNLGAGLVVTKSCEAMVDRRTRQIIYGCNGGFE